MLFVCGTFLFGLFLPSWAQAAVPQTPAILEELDEPRTLPPGATAETILNGPAEEVRRPAVPVIPTSPPSPIPPDFDGRRGKWDPLGILPVDQAGTNNRGYNLAVEGARVTKPGQNRFDVHLLTSNYLYREQTADILADIRYETHAVALGYRRGFKVNHLPRFELGGQIQLEHDSGGYLNGFIKSFEGYWGRLVGHGESQNPIRLGQESLPLPGYHVERNGQSVYSHNGQGLGFGDVSLIAKIALKEGDPFSKATHIAVRVAANLATGASKFSQGNYVGAGVSLEKKLTEWIALHGDLRAALPLDRKSKIDFPLRPGTLGASTGLEFRLTRNTSFSLQADGNSTPYERTGTLGFDKEYGAVSLGLARRFQAGSKYILTQFYGRENLNLPFKVRGNLDPDFAIGLKVTISKRD